MICTPHQIHSDDDDDDKKHKTGLTYIKNEGEEKRIQDFGGET